MKQKTKKTITKKKITKKKVVKVVKKKKVVAKKPKKKAPLKKPKVKVLKKKPDRYFEAVGRRKTSIARVRLFTRGEKIFLVNDKNLKEYFPVFELQQIVVASLRKMKSLEKFRVSIKVKGGGIRAQAEAIRHATARALVKFNPNFKKRLKKAGYLTRDSRMKERKKFGLKKARRAPQWQKR